MTDLELYKDMLVRANLAFVEQKVEKPSAPREAWFHPWTEQIGWTFISVEQTDGHVGYSGFGSIHAFDAEGKLVAVGGAE